MLPRTVTLVGAQMTLSDIPALLHFKRLEGICAHRFKFAADLLRCHERFPRLRSIAVSNTLLTNSDVSTLSGRTGLASLHFAAIQITDDALAHLGTLPDLEVLDIRETRVTDVGLMLLSRLRNLFTIDVQGTAVSAAGARAYRDHVAKWLPDVEVLFDV
jgi:hypothetical protein